MGGRRVQKTTWQKGTLDDRKWYVFDASTTNIGRLSTEIARRLMGKHKESYVENMDVGDCVVVLNTDNIKVSSQKKLLSKRYYSHSMFPKGFKNVGMYLQMKRDSRKVLIAAVAGMLPKTKLKDRYLSRLHVFKENEHTYEAQKPEKVEVK